MRGSRGFSLIEVLAGMLILSFVITTSLGVFYERERTHRRAEEMMLAWQVLSNESEIVRRIPFGHLDALHDGPFRSNLELLESLDSLSSRIEVTEARPRLKDVTLTLTWGGGRGHAAVTVLRSDTGGSSLW
ncbi:MAG TPA: prepilin-type N-terminal cleavage/methylation domain-containing protein [Thermoanaerobaculia bacterium]|nr:prepilin-type N-terminal cleavage/methylation domain-containing protein [Thermoanaerobaculia bacterium]